MHTPTTTRTGILRLKKGTCVLRKVSDQSKYTTMVMHLWEWQSQHQPSQRLEVRKSSRVVLKWIFAATSLMIASDQRWVEQNTSRLPQPQPSLRLLTSHGHSQGWHNYMESNVSRLCGYHRTWTTCHSTKHLQPPDIDNFRSSENLLVSNKPERILKEKKREELWPRARGEPICC